MYFTVDESYRVGVRAFCGSISSFISFSQFIFKAEKWQSLDWSKAIEFSVLRCSLFRPIQLRKTDSLYPLFIIISPTNWWMKKPSKPEVITKFHVFTFCGHLKLKYHRALTEKYTRTHSLCTYETHVLDDKRKNEEICTQWNYTIYDDWRASIHTFWLQASVISSDWVDCERETLRKWLRKRARERGK